MSPKRYYTFMIEQELINALKVGKEQTGLSEGGQIRQALKAWFAEHGINWRKATRKREVARKRPKPWIAAITLVSPSINSSPMKLRAC